MGALDFKDKACDEYNGKSYDAYKQLRSMRNLTRGPQNEASRALRKIKGQSPSPDVNSALNDLENELDDRVPDLSDAEQIADIIEGCTPLKDLLSGTGSLTDAVDFMGDMVGDISNDVFNEAIGSIMAGIAEYASGLDILNVGDLFNSLGLDKVLGGLDGLLDCISNMCPGPGTDDLIWATQQLQDDMMFTDDGQFDTDALLSNVGITGGQKTNIDMIEARMTSMRKDSEDKMTAQVTKMFENVKLEEKKKYLGKISSYF